MATTLNDVFNATTVTNMHINARHYAGDVFGVSWGDSEQWVAENLPEVQRIVDLRNSGEVDPFGNYVNVPNYNRIDSINNPMGAVNTSAPDAPVNVVDTSIPITQEGILSDPSPFTGTIQDTLFDSSRDYAESDFGQSVGAVPYTEDFVPTTLSFGDSGGESDKGASSVLSQVQSNVPTRDPFSPIVESGFNFLPTNLTGQFYGIDPTTNQVGIMQDRTQNPLFRSGVAGFADMLPTGFEFGTPFVYRDSGTYLPQLYEDFLAEKEAEAEEQRNNRYTFQGMGADFDQSRLNESYTDS